VFSGLSGLVIREVTGRDSVIVVRAQTPDWPVPCPRCGGLTGQVHVTASGPSPTCPRMGGR